jgi:hypothetical protein
MQENPKVQELRMFFNLLESASTSALDRLEVLTETLRELLPGFADTYQKQSKAQAKRREEQRLSIDGGVPQSRHQPIDLLQDLFGK